MIRIIALCTLLFLAACHNPLDQLTPVDMLPNYILEDMDASVIKHLEALTDEVKTSQSKDDKAHFDAWLQLAHALHGYELFEGAELAYTNARLFKQRPSAVTYQLAHLYRLQSKYQLSNELLRQVIEQVPDYTPAYRNLAENLFDQGSLEEARAVIQKSLIIEKDDAYGLQIYANVLSQLNEVDSATEALEQALALQPKGTKLYFNLAQLFQMQGQQEAANQARAKGGEGKLSTKDPWLSEVTDDLRGFNPFIAKSQSFLAVNDFKSAEFWAEKAAADRPNSFTTQMLLGVIKVKLGQPDQALPYFLKARQQRPGDFKVNLNLGTTYKDLGNYPSSIEYYNRALTIDGGHLSAKLSLADALCLSNQDDKSMVLVEELQQTSFQQQALFVGLKCQIQHKQYHKAYQYVQDNIELVSNYGPFLEYAILLLATTPIDEHRSGNRALDWLEQLMKQQPTNKRKQLLIMALMELNRFDEAQKVLNALRPTKDLFIPKQSLQHLLQNKMPFRMSVY